MTGSHMAASHTAASHATASPTTASHATARLRVMLVVVAVVLSACTPVEVLTVRRALGLPTDNRAQINQIAAAFAPAWSAATGRPAPDARPLPTTSTPILGEARTDLASARAWATANGATDGFIRRAAGYWNQATARGVRPEVAYVQSAKETDFGRYTGVVSPDFKNSCGIKTTQGGEDFDPDAHQRFDTWTEGIVACICLLYTSPSPRDATLSRMPSSA